MEMVPVHWPTLLGKYYGFYSSYSKKDMENPCSLSWLDRKLPPSGRGLSLDRWLTLLQCCDLTPGLWQIPPSAHGIAEWRGTTKVSNDGRSPEGHALFMARKNSGNQESQLIDKELPRFFLKWLRRHLEKEQVLKKNYTLELFDFELHQRIKLCPECSWDIFWTWTTFG